MKPVSPQDQTYPPRKPEDMNPYPMVRCSSKRQRLGDTDTRQTENAKLECARRGWPWKPELIVRDLGVSAYHAMNFKPSSELGRFIEAAEKQLLLPNPVLICENPDRFSRAQIDNADGTLWRLVRYGVDVLFMSGSLYLTRGDENDAATRTRIIWEFDRSRKESQRKAFFAGATMTRKLREASEGRKVDFGTHLPVWIDFNKGPIPSYTFNEREDTLRLMVKLAMAGESLFRISRELNGRGIGFRGGMWTGDTVLNMLHNTKLIGDLHLCEHHFPGYFPALLTLPEWDALQAKLMACSIKNGKRGGQSPGEKVWTLFPAMITCAACGGRVATKSLHGGRHKPYSYYCCLSSFHRTGCIDKSTIRVQALELDFFGAYLMQLPQEVLTSQDKSVVAKSEALQLKLKDLNQKIKFYVDMASQVGMEEITLKLQALKEERTALQHQIDGELTESMLVRSSFDAWKRICSEFGVNSSIKEFVAGGAKMALKLTGELKDQATRQKLRKLTGSLISGIKLDLEKKRYAVKSLAGHFGEWRDISSIITALSLAGLERKIQSLREHPCDPILLKWTAEHRKKYLAAIAKRHELGLRYKRWSPASRAAQRARMASARKEWLARWAADRGIPVEKAQEAFANENRAIRAAVKKARKAVRKAAPEGTQADEQAVKSAAAAARLSVKAAAMGITPSALKAQSRAEGRAGLG